MQLGNIQWRTSCVLGFVLGACDERKRKGSTSRDCSKCRPTWLPFLSWPVLWAGQASACEDRSSSSESGRGKMGFSLTELEVEEVSVCVCTPVPRCVPVSLRSAVTLHGALLPYPSDLIHRLLPYSLYSSLLAKHSGITPSYLLVPLPGILAQTATSPSPRWVSMLRPPYQRGLF